MWVNYSPSNEYGKNTLIISAILRLEALCFLSTFDPNKKSKVMNNKQIILTGLFIFSCICGYSQSVSFSRSRSHLSQKTINARVKADSIKRSDLIKLAAHPREVISKSMIGTMGLYTFNENDTVPTINDMTSQIQSLDKSISNFKSQTRQGLKDTIKKLKQLRDDEIAKLQDNTEDSIVSFERKFITNGDTVEAYSTAQLDKSQNSIATIKKSTRSAIIALRENSNARLFLPAFYSRESIAFYTEKDTLASKFFSDNALLYNSSLQKLTYGTEAFADYFGPVRLGLGYAITSTSNTKDSNKTQSDAIQKIITNGGNVNYNISFPLFAFTTWDLLKVKASFTTKGGIDIPKDSASVSTYGYLTSTGINLNVYSVGILGVIQVFGTSRMSYVLGNKNFEQHVQQNSFFLWQNSIGVAVKDKYRVRFDVYSGLSGSANAQFVRSNFPVTLSFDVINPF